MRTALLLTVLLVFSAGAALATTSFDPGVAVPVEPYTYVGDSPVNVAIFMDQLPWGSAAVTDVLTSYGVSYTVYGSAQMGTVDLGPFDKVIIASNQTDAYYNALGTNQAFFEDYMLSGGCMLLSCAAYFGLGNEQITWPGGFGHYVGDGANVVSIMAPAHPVFNDPLTVSSSDLQNWNFSSHGAFSSLPAGAEVTIENVDNLPGTPAAFDFGWGDGGAYVTAQPYDWVGAGNPYIVNIVLYTCGSVPTAVESTTWGAIKALYE